jgi:hypothetical protein
MCICSTQWTTVYHYLPVFSLQSVKLKSHPHKSYLTSATAIPLQYVGEVLPQGPKFSYLQPQGLSAVKLM